MVCLSASDCHKELAHVIDNLATTQTEDAAIPRCALAHNSISDMSTFHSVGPKDFETFDCDKPTSEGKTSSAPSPKGNVGQLKTLKHCVCHSSQLGNIVKDWRTMQPEDCDDFKFSECNDDDAPSARPSTNAHSSPGTGTSGGGGATTSAMGNKARDFHCNVTLLSFLNSSITKTSVPGMTALNSLLLLKALMMCFMHLSFLLQLIKMLSTCLLNSKSA